MIDVYHKISEAFQCQNTICVVLRNAIDSYLVGKIEYYNHDGILLYNIDYRGVATCHVYISIEEIEEIAEKQYYINKINTLLELRESKREFLAFPYKAGLKKDFLNWIYSNHKLIEITFEDEQFEGYVNKIEDSFIDINKICTFTGKDEGHVIIRDEYLTYFSVETSFSESVKLFL